VSNEDLSGRDIGMGKKHQSLKMSGVENHVSDAAPMSSVASGFHFRVFQVASYHWFVLSDNSSFIHDILTGCRKIAISPALRGISVLAGQ
jgi:hypothetical protein